MKPRVFVSSTFYDLKYIREDISNFIKAHDFESIMFEDGDIGYTPGKPLDNSCYESMRNADMVILIIGGLYGSAATGEDTNYSSYESITKKEFNTAVKNNVPVFCFIDKAVHSEYEIYRLNKSNLENREDFDIEFSATKNINVFRFIECIYDIGNIPVNSFEKSEEIKDYMSRQWSDMFKKYLELLKEESQSNLLNNTVDNMNTILQQMKIMVDKIGEKTISSKDYEEVIDIQKRMEIETLVNEMTKSINFIVPDDNVTDKERNVNLLLDTFKKTFMKFDFENEYLFDDEDCIKFIADELSKVFSDCSLRYSLLNNYKLGEFVLDDKLKNELSKYLQDDKYYYKIFYNNHITFKKNIKFKKE